MGVLTCNRKGCDHIMCDFYSYKFGYICGDCLIELRDSGLDTATFMATEKTEGKQYNYDEEFQVRG